MNETLEEMARAIFKSWFVDFEPVHAKAAGNEPAHMDAYTVCFQVHLVMMVCHGLEFPPLGDVTKITGEQHHKKFYETNTELTL